MSKEIIGKDLIKKESIAYIGTNGLRKISYIQLYNYLTDVKKHILLMHNDVYKTDSISLLQVLTEISAFSIKEYDDIPKKYSLQFANTQEKIDKVHEAIETEKIRFKNLEFDINESIYKEFENEARVKRSETDAALSISISKAALVVALAAFGMTTFQSYLGYVDRKNNNASAHTNRLIEQNDTIIHLLQKQYETHEEPEVILPEIIADSMATDSIPN